VFLVVGHFFVYYIFSGIVIDSFNRMKDKLNGYQIIKQDQRNWIEIQKLLIRRNLVVK